MRNCDGQVAPRHQCGPSHWGGGGIYLTLGHGCLEKKAEVVGTAHYTWNEQMKARHDTIHGDLNGSQNSQQTTWGWGCKQHKAASMGVT